MRDRSWRWRWLAPALAGVTLTLVGGCSSDENAGRGSSACTRGDCDASANAGAPGTDAATPPPTCAAGNCDASAAGGAAGAIGSAGSPASAGGVGAGGTSSTSPGATGDPCTSSDDCVSPGICGVDGYCFRRCDTDADCVGSGPGGTNRFGLLNTCTHFGTGQGYCWLGCATDAQCAELGSPFATCCGIYRSSLPYCQTNPCSQGTGGAPGAGGSIGAGGATSSGGITSAGGTTGAGGSAGPRAVSCWQNGPHDASEPWCFCATSGSTGTPTYDGLSCVECDYAGLPFLCCARDGYPYGGACDCYVTGTWNCKSYTSSCSCSFTPPGSNPTSVCDAAPGPDGHPWRCCSYPSSSQCYCQKDGPPCQAGGTEVSDCAPLAGLGIASAPLSCPAGTTHVSTCSQGLGGSKCPGNCTNDSQCPGDCNGDDPLCCPSCVDGHCGQCCTGTSGSACF